VRVHDRGDGLAVVVRMIQPDRMTQLVQSEPMKVVDSVGLQWASEGVWNLN
jgi:hypothetical protein